MSLPLPIVNLETATFECVYGRGCEGLCCRESEPPVTGDEIERLTAHLPRVLPHLRPEARARIEVSGFLDGLHADGQPKLAMSDSWCVFFNAGCVLHKLGAAEGDPRRYKPIVCSLFPLQENERGEWYVRQWGVESEEWELFCLDPKHSAKPAAESLRTEIALVRQLGPPEPEPTVLPFPPALPVSESA